MSEKIASSDIAPFSTLFSRIISREREPAVLSPLHLIRHSLSSHCQCCRWRYAARPNPWDLEELRQLHVAHHVICKIEKQELKETSKNSNEYACHGFLSLLYNPGASIPSKPIPGQALLARCFTCADGSTCFPGELSQNLILIPDNEYLLTLFPEHICNYLFQLLSIPYILLFFGRAL